MLNSRTQVWRCSPNGTNFYATPRPLDELPVATQRGIITFQRTAPGAAWQEVRRTLPEICTSARSTLTPRAIFAGTLTAAVCGRAWMVCQTWEPRDRGLAHDNVYALSFVQVGDQLRLYAGAPPAHCYVSTDLGERYSLRLARAARRA